MPIDKLDFLESATIPFWIRGCKLGHHQFKLVFYYEPYDSSKEMKYRVHREEFQFTVVPSIRTSHWVHPSLSKPNSYTLGIQFTPLQANIGFQIIQVSSVSGRWVISPLSSTTNDSESDSAFSIQPGESFTTVFSITENFDFHSAGLIYSNHLVFYSPLTPPYLYHSIFLIIISFS